MRPFDITAEQQNKLAALQEKYRLFFEALNKPADGLEYEDWQVLGSQEIEAWIKLYACV